MSMKETMEQELAEAIATLEKANGALARIFGINEEESEHICTDCHKVFNINKGTYDSEWGFHCIYCGGIGQEGESE